MGVRRNFRRGGGQAQKGPHENRKGKVLAVDAVKTQLTVLK